MQKPQKQAFTLVELIIVVTILAILATIAFMSFQGYTSKTRDSKRVTELKNIENGLQIYQTQTSKYPIPDDKIIATYSGAQLIYSGKINTQLQQILKLSELPKDPVNQELYNYGTSKDGKYYQLSSILENEISYNPLIETTYANSQSGYLSYVIGNYKGIYKDGTTIYNVPSLLIKSTTDTTIDTTTKFIIKNQTNEGVDTQTALKELTGSGGITLTGVIIPTDWKTNSGTLSQTLGYNVDEIGQTIYGDKYLAGNTTTPTNTQVVETPVIPTKITIIGDETTGRKWSDNTYATSCNGYKNPTGNNEYSGNVGDGVYLIKPDANTEFKVYCDMTTDGGGWTLIATTNGNYGLENTEAVGFFNFPVSTNFTVKFSDDTIRKIMSLNYYYLTNDNYTIKTFYHTTNLYTSIGGNNNLTCAHSFSELSLQTYTTSNYGCIYYHNFSGFITPESGVTCNASFGNVGVCDGSDLWMPSYPGHFGVDSGFGGLGSGRKGYVYIK